MAGLTRLAVTGKDILIYSNCDSPSGRKQGTVWASFDGGKSWPIKRLVYAAVMPIRQSLQVVRVQKVKG